MTEHVIKGDPPVTVHLRQSGRARRISLRVSRLDGKVTLTHPSSVSERVALDFAYKRADWLRGHEEFMKGVADVFVNAGSIDSALDTYENAVNTAPLAAAN